MSLGFGAPSSAPATSALSGGFSFGANTSKPATGFGLNTSQPSLFGTPATSAPAFGGLGGTTPGFGAGSTPSFGATSTPGFGATSTPAFGATSTPGFGATSTAGFGTTGLGAGLNFGAGSNTTTTSTGLGFGAPISSATSGGLSFGAPAASAAGLGGFSFTGLPAATSASSLGFGLGSTAATTLPSLFEPKMFPIFEDTPPAQHFMSIPITQTFQMIPQFSMPYQHIEASCYGRSSAQPCDTINQACGTMNQACGTMNQACMTNTDIVHLKNPKRCSFSVMAPSFGTSLGATNTSLAATAAPVNVGLGGLATTSAGATGTADVSAAGKGSSEQQPKQTALPNELSATVEAFKEFVKRQKSLGADVMRVSIKPLQKVSRQAEETIRAVVAFTGEAGRERAHARRLRAAAARALAAAERAGRGPPGADSEDLAPPGYVLELISELEAQLLTFRRQMDVADRQMQAPQRLLTERELSLGMRRMHESLIALAGRLQAVHVQVQEQKERYLELRRQLLKDNTDVFRTSSGDSLEQLVREAGGERSGAAHARGRAVLSDPRAALGSAQHVAGPTPFTYLGSTLSALPAADTTAGLSWAPPPAQSSVSFGSPGFTSLAAPSDSSTGFQLQKAPKRGKQ